MEKDDLTWETIDALADELAPKEEVPMSRSVYVETSEKIFCLLVSREKYLEILDAKRKWKDIDVRLDDPSMTIPVQMVNLRQ